MTDVRDTLFQKISEKRYRAVLTAEHSGVLSGEAEARACAENLGIEFELCKKDGDELSRGERFLNIGCAFWALVIGVVVSLICESGDFKAAKAEAAAE